MSTVHNLITCLKLDTDRYEMSRAKPNAITFTADKIITKN